VPRLATSVDGAQLVYYLPNFVPEQSLVSRHFFATLVQPHTLYLCQDPFNQSIYEYADVVPPHTTKTKTSDAKKGSYIHKPGQITGEVRVVKTWHGIGQGVSPSLSLLSAVLTNFRV
jgi:hypothetical protein